MTKLTIKLEPANVEWRRKRVIEKAETLNFKTGNIIDWPPQQVVSIFNLTEGEGEEFSSRILQMFLRKS